MVLNFLYGGNEKWYLNDFFFEYHRNDTFLSWQLNVRDEAWITVNLQVDLDGSTEAVSIVVAPRRDTIECEARLKGDFDYGILLEKEWWQESYNCQKRKNNSMTSKDPIFNFWNTYHHSRFIFNPFPMMSNNPSTEDSLLSINWFLQQYLEWNLDPLHFSFLPFFNSLSLS